jgi:trigger factor
LKIESQTLEDHQVKLTVEVETEKLSEAKIQAARKLAKQVKIPGFRPGKAPYQVVARQVGDAAILEEAMELLIDDVYPKVIEEAEIHPYGPGKLEKIVSTEPPVFEFVVPLEAKVVLGDYRSIRHPYELKEVPEQDVANVLDDLRERQAVIEPVDRPAQPGDLVDLLLGATRTTPVIGEEAVLIRERSTPIVITSHPEDEEDVEAKREWPYPGFSSQVIGLSADDEKTFTYSFADDAEFEALRGIEAEFHFRVEDVKSRTLPELNDEFASTVGEYSSLEALRSEIRSDLEQHAKQEYDEEYEDEILQEAIDQSDIKYPPQMLEHEVDSVIDNLKNRLERQKLEMDLYLKSRQMDMDGLRAEARPVAESRLKRTLVLLEIANAEKLEVSQEELQNETVRTMDVLSRTLPEKDARRLNNRQVFSNVVENVMADMVIKQALVRLRDISSGKVQESLEETPEISSEISPEAISKAAPEEIPGSIEEATPQPESLDAPPENDQSSSAGNDEVSIIEEN